MSEKRKKYRTYIPDLAKSFIVNLYKTFEQEKCRRRPFTSYDKVYLRVAKALKVPESTVKSIVKSQSLDNRPLRKLQVEKRGRKPKCDSFDEGLIRRTVHQIYKKNQFLSLNILLDELKYKDINISKSTLSRILTKLGFKYYRKMERDLQLNKLIS